jgi:hypothetical protein
LAFFAALGSLALAQAAGAQTFTVAASHDDGPGVCPNACTLRGAI